MGPIQMNDRPNREENMKTVLIIVAVLAFASAGTAGEYFKWVDERGVVHITNIPSSVPQEYKEKAERKVMPTESETSAESPQAAKQGTGESRDRYGRGRDYWLQRANVAKGNLYRAQSQYERLRREYGDLLDAYDKTTSLAKRDEYKKQMESLQNEMRRRSEDIFAAREMLEKTLPDEAASAGAPLEWVR